MKVVVRLANIKEKINNIREAIFGKDVRGSLADGLDAVNKETEDATKLSKDTEHRQTVVETQFDDQIRNMSLDDPSSAEMVAGRTNTITGENYSTIGERLDAENKTVTSRLVQTNTEIDNLGKRFTYITPEMFGYNPANPDDDSIRKWLDYAKENEEIARTTDLEINSDIDFRGVELIVEGVLNIKSHNIILGGSSNTRSNPTQYIRLIHQVTENTQAFIKGAKGQKITIERCKKVSFKLSNGTDDSSIAYSIFNLKYVDEVVIENEEGHDGNLWFNENQLHLARTTYFKMDGTYHHNNNRIYGGTFESDGRKIDILSGHNNHFYDMRFEGVTEIYCAESTRSNIFYQTWQSSYPFRGANLIENGYGNKVILPNFNFSKIIESENVNVVNLSGKPKFKFAESNNRLTATSWKEIYNSGFMVYKPSLFFECNIEDLTEGGIRVKYQLYDATYNILANVGENIASLEGMSGGMAHDVLLPGINNENNAKYYFLGKTIDNVKYIKFIVTAGGNGLNCLQANVLIKNLSEAI